VQWIAQTPRPDQLSIVYGILRGTGEILRACDDTGCDYLYMDHSYFDATRRGHDGVRGTDHFRIVPNDRYFRFGGDMPADRWLRLGIEISPWRGNGTHIVLVPVSRFVAEYNGITPEQWVRETVARLREHTDRPIVAKPKDVDQPLAEVLDGAWALVTMESNAAVQAAIAGVPVFTSCSAAAFPFGCDDLSAIEDPPMPQRVQHLHNLAYQQFTFEEIRNGTARAILIDQFGDQSLEVA
jgi:hypothetical protein